MKESELKTSRLHHISNHAKRNKMFENYRRPNFINYHSVSPFPYEMHQSKIVSLKNKSKNSFTHCESKPSYSSKLPATKMSNGIQYSSNRPLPKISPSQASTLRHNPHGNKKVKYPAAFYSPSGKSLSFNNIVFSSDNSSSSDECDVYEEIDSHTANRSQPAFVAPQQSHSQSPNPNFAAKIIEVCDMLSQGHSFPNHLQRPLPNQFDPASSAIIDELAKRMYHVLQMNHFQGNKNGPISSNISVSQNHNGFQQNIPNNHSYSQNEKYLINEEIQNKQNSVMSEYDYPLYQCYSNKVESNFSPNVNCDTVHNQQVNLPPSETMHNRQMNQSFKSATSQEIHNLYTSQYSTKNCGTVVSSQPHNGDKSYCTAFRVENGNCNGELCNETNIHHYERKPQWEFNKEKTQNGRCNASVMVCRAEKESESELFPTSEHHIDEAISTLSDGWKYFDRGLFRPIKEDKNYEDSVDDTCKKKHFTQFNGNKKSDKDSFLKADIINCTTTNGENRSAFLSRSFKEVCKKIDEKDEDTFQGKNESNHKDIQLSISLLMNNMPKPPSFDCCSAITKSSSSQTDISNDYADDKIKPVDNSLQCEIKTVDASPSLDNDESFIMTNISTQNVKNVNSSSNSSLNSDASSSAISSAGSCYYYSETKQPPNVTKYVCSNKSEISVTDELCSTTLPTMGISMLGVKRSPSNSSNEQGSNFAIPYQNFGSVVGPASVISKTVIITDVEHTI